MVVPSYCGCTHDADDYFTTGLHHLYYALSLPRRSLPIRLGPNVRHLLSYSGPAVLTAIAAPILLVHQQQLDLASDNAYLWGALMAIVVAHRTGSVYWTIGLGMLIFMLVGL